MTVSTGLSLCAAMMILTIIPGPAVVLVIARTLSRGFGAGVVTSAGVVVGIFIFTLLSICGLSSIPSNFEGVFLAARYFSAVYLVWLGVRIVIEKNEEKNGELPDYYDSTNFISGFVVSMLNPKAVIFYINFFPQFIDFSTADLVDMSVILLVTTLSVGSVLIVYAYLAEKSSVVLRGPIASKCIKFFSAGVLMIGGVYAVAIAS